MTRANFRAGYVCTRNTLIWLVGIRGKTCPPTRAQVTLSFDWLAFAVKLAHQTSFPRMPTNQIRVLPVHAKPARKYARVTGQKFDFYHLGYWFSPQWKLIFAAVEIAFTILEIDFYYHRNWFLSPWQLILTPWKIYYYHSFIYSFITFIYTIQNRILTPFIFLISYIFTFILLFLPWKFIESIKWRYRRCRVYTRGLNVCGFISL